MDEKKIKRFLLDQSDYIEAEEVSAYLRDHIELLDTIDVFLECGEVCEICLSKSRKDQLYRRIMGRSRPGIFRLSRIAAAAIVLLVVFGLYMWNGNTSVSVIPLACRFAQKDVSTIVNLQKDVIAILLPDSTEVTLSPFAAISYRFGHFATRYINLKRGTAYFKVFPDSQRPFIVLSNGIRTTALGTAFRVENKIDEQTIKVKLAEGKVSVESSGKNFTMKPVYLHPSQECWIDKRTGHVRLVEKKKVVASTRADVSSSSEDVASSANKVLWTNENLQFSKASLQNVLHKLGSRHDVIIVADENTIDRMTLTGKILYSDSLSMIIKSICEINDLKYERRNDTIILRK